jgi:hypothetical protein
VEQPHGTAKTSQPKRSDLLPVFRLRATVNVVIVVASFFFAAAALYAGGPFLGNELAIEWLVLALVAAGSGIWWAFTCWESWRTLARSVAVIGGLAAVVFFGVGLVSTTVVIDGEVFATTSETYKEVSYAQELADDLIKLGAMDSFLAANVSEAWSKTDDIKKAQVESFAIGQKYSEIIDNSLIPAGELGPATASTVAAAYAMSKALETRLTLIASGTDELDSDLSEARNAFAQEWQRAGTELGAAVELLRIPLVVEEGPGEA